MGLGWLGLLVEETIVAGGEGVVHVYLNALPGKHAELVEVTEGVEEGGGKAVASAGGLGGFSVPERLAGLVFIAERGIEAGDFLRARQPLVRESRRLA